MHIERIHKMQECLTEKAVNELEKGVENVDTSEMGQVVDMIKDLAEAEYHSIISKAMKKADEEEEEYDKELLRSLKAEYGEESGRRYYDQYRYAMADLPLKAVEHVEDMKSHHIIICR